MQYLTVRESVKRLRQAGLAADAREILDWVRDRKVQDVWVVGGHTYIYEAELDALIAAGAH